MATYRPGQVVAITATFSSDPAGTTKVDPTGVAFSFTPRGGSTTTWTYGTDPQVSRTGLGTYVVNLTIPNVPGILTYDFTGTGSNAGVYHGTLVVSG